MVDSIDVLQAKIEALRAQNAAMQTNPLPSVLTLPVGAGSPINADITSLVDSKVAALEKKFASVVSTLEQKYGLSSAKAAASPSPASSPVAEMSKLIEGHLEQEEIAWLMTPDVSSRLPEFLAAAGGGKVVRRFYTDFKEFCAQSAGDTK